MNVMFVVVIILLERIVRVYPMVMQNLMNVAYAAVMVRLKDILAMVYLNFLYIMVHLNRPFIILKP